MDRVLKLLNIRNVDLLESKYNICEHEFDWALIVRTDESFAGQSTLIVPKEHGGIFEVSSGYPCDKEKGVSFTYSLRIKKINSKKDVAYLLSQYLQQPVVEIFKKLKKGNDISDIGEYFIYEPLSLRKELYRLGTDIEMLRINDKGGYPFNIP